MSIRSFKLWVLAFKWSDQVQQQTNQRNNKQRYRWEKVALIIHMIFQILQGSQMSNRNKRGKKLKVYSMEAAAKLRENQEGKKHDRAEIIHEQSIKRFVFFP